MRSLYEIDNGILECVDPETGEVIDEERLTALELEWEQKISGVACWYKDLRAEAEAIKAEKQNLDKRQKAAENKAEQLKKYLAYALNGQKFKDARVSISYRKSEEVVVDEAMDLRKLPEDLLRVKLEPNKTAIKEVIKEGMTVEGCQLITNNNIQIR